MKGINAATANFGILFHYSVIGSEMREDVLLFIYGMDTDRYYLK